MSCFSVGVTGLPCTGKSRAAKAIAAQGALLLEADIISRELLQIPEIRHRVENRLTIPPGLEEVDFRQAVANIVFSIQDSLSWLEHLLHPLVRQQIEKQLSTHSGPVVIEAALLFSSGLADLCDVIFLLETSENIRFKRAQSRGWNENELTRRSARQNSQFSSSYLEPWKDKIICIDNNTDDGKLDAEIQYMFNKSYAYATQRKDAQ